jgi:hypothetical protein
MTLAELEALVAERRAALGNAHPETPTSPRRCRSNRRWSKGGERISARRIPIR